MARVATYNTDSTTRSAQEQGIYHDDDICPLGQKLLAAEKVAGIGTNKTYCILCKG